MSSKRKRSIEESDMEHLEIITESVKIIGRDLGCSSSLSTPHHPPNCGKNEDLLVCPWMVIVTNIHEQLKNGRYVLEKPQKWIGQGYNPSKVHLLQDIDGQSGIAVVQFDKGWAGFGNALAFEKALEVDRRGKSDWFSTRPKGDKPYGWLAGEEYYWSEGSIGKYLQKYGALKTLSEIQMAEKRKNEILMGILRKDLQSKRNECEDVTKKISVIEILEKFTLQKEDMVQSYNQEMQMVLNDASALLWKKAEEHVTSKKCLEDQGKVLRLREKELKKLEAFNDSEKRKCDSEEKMSDKEIMERSKPHEKYVKLLEEQKKECILNMIQNLEARLDTQSLQLDIEQMRDEVVVWNNVIERRNLEDLKMLEIIEKLKNKEQEISDVGMITQALIIRERNTNNEVLEAKKELIRHLNGKANICVRWMGDLDTMPFKNAAQRKYDNEDVRGKTLELHLTWNYYLRDPSWHPFKAVMVGNISKEVLDENDERLKELKNELGEDVYKAVTTALLEMKEYNPSGWYPVQELWNSAENRKASLKEAIECMLKLWKQKNSNKKKRRNCRVRS